MLKVLHCVGYMRRAGIETFIMNIYRNIDKHEIQFNFLCSELKHGDYDQEINDLGGKIYYLNQFCHNKNTPIIKYIFKILQYRNSIKKIKEKNEVDIVHIHTYHAFDAFLMIMGCKLAGIKNIFVHSHNTSAPHPKLNKIFSLFLRHMKITRLACGIEAGKWLYGNNSEFKVIYNGIDINKYAFDKNKRILGRKKLEISNNAHVLLHVGRFEDQKNHQFLIKVFNEYFKKDRSAVLLLAGNGALQPKIKQEANNLISNNNIKFLGVRKDVDVLMNLADLFVMPSLYEGFPVTAIEAEASGLPCLFADTITDEVKVIKTVRFENLNSNINSWVKDFCEMLMLKQNRFKAKECVFKAGFDIKEVSQELEKLYLDK